MPRYNPNLTTAQAGILILPKGDYEFGISDPKLFSRKSAGEGGVERHVFGVQYNLVVKTTGEYEGKTIPLQLYMHTENSFGMNKQFVMAALGSSINQEDEFNEKYADADWSIDTDENEMGDIWKNVGGNMISATADIVPDKRDVERKQQRWSWRPV